MSDQTFIKKKKKNRKSIALIRNQKCKKLEKIHSYTIQVYKIISL